MTKKNIYVAGHNGMVGSALVRQLQNDPKNSILTTSRNQLDLTNQAAVNKYFQENRIDEVYLAAAKVGGIHANSEYPADFIYVNIMIQANIINAAHKNNVQKLLFLGSSCIYPKYAEQPIVETSLLTGVLEKTNEPYAIAKIAGIKLCESYKRQYGRDYRSVMPTNLYGEGDNYHHLNSHVVPGLIRKLYEAKINNTESIEAWGSGSPRREFLHVDDMANASIFVMDIDKLDYEKIITNDLTHINVGYGSDITIKELAEMLKEIIGYKGSIIWNKAMPDGTPKKLMSTKLLNGLGWFPQIVLREGLIRTVSDYVKNVVEK